MLGTKQYPLHTAVEEFNVYKVILLLNDKLTKINEKNDKGDTALLCAVKLYIDRNILIKNKILCKLIITALIIHEANFRIFDNTHRNACVYLRDFKNVGDNLNELMYAYEDFSSGSEFNDRFTLFGNEYFRKFVEFIDKSLLDIIDAGVRDQNLVTLKAIFQDIKESAFNEAKSQLSAATTLATNFSKLDSYLKTIIQPNSATLAEVVMKEDNIKNLTQMFEFSHYIFITTCALQGLNILAIVYNEFANNEHTVRGPICTTLLTSSLAAYYKNYSEDKIYPTNLYYVQLTCSAISLIVPEWRGSNINMGISLMSCVLSLVGLGLSNSESTFLKALKNDVSKNLS